jgi:membrane protease YdiL (CAAX protease family)
MQFDFFLWPMLLPMVLPILYVIRYKKESFSEVSIITCTMVLIVIAYWPLTVGLESPSNIATKFVLFVCLPLMFLYIPWKIRKKQNKDFPFHEFGITHNGLEKSLKLGLLFIPLMLLVTLFAQYLISGISDPYIPLGAVSFIESFTEEFFFRGILFLFLLPRTNLPVAYITSLSCFVLMHPQNITNPFIFSTILQGFLTLEICRRSKNLIGAWVLHGTNRFFSIVILPFLM